MAMPYRFETTRLVARCWSPADAPALFAAVESSVEHLRRWLPWVAGRPATVEAQAEVLRRFRASFDLDQDHAFGLFERGTGHCVGGFGLHPRAGGDAFELGYWLRADCTGRGLATEALAGAGEVAFALTTVRRLQLHCATGNLPSARLARRLGFTHEATLRARLPWEHGHDDAMLWVLWRDAFSESPPSGARVVAFDCLDRVVARSASEASGAP
jgi:RimJ/RimL family protein N-acetyltransferase